MDLTTININKYRIKTKEEFETEFGKNWRDGMSYSFPESMDYSLGSKLSNLHVVNKNKEKIKIKDINSKVLWNIDENMIKKIINKKEKIQWI